MRYMLFQLTHGPCSLPSGLVNTQFTAPTMTFQCKLCCCLGLYRSCNHLYETNTSGNECCSDAVAFYAFPTITDRKKKWCSQGLQKLITVEESVTVTASALNHPAGMSVTAVITFPDLGLLYRKRAAGFTSCCSTQHNARARDKGKAHTQIHI